jgi:hypothetical protein
VKEPTAADPSAQALLRDLALTVARRHGSFLLRWETGSPRLSH